MNKRIPQLLEAFTLLRRRRPGARLLLVGVATERFDLDRRLERLGIGGEALDPRGLRLRGAAPVADGGLRRARQPALADDGRDLGLRHPRALARQAAARLRRRLVLRAARRRGAEDPRRRVRGGDDRRRARARGRPRRRARGSRPRLRRTASTTSAASPTPTSPRSRRLRAARPSPTRCSGRIAEAAAEDRARRSGRARPRSRARRGSCEHGHGRARARRRRSRPGVWLAGIVVVSIAVRVALAHRIVAPWIMVDEIVYSELAKSFAAHGQFLVRGVPSHGYGFVYPLLIAPAWRLFGAIPAPTPPPRRSTASSCRSPRSRPTSSPAACCPRGSRSSRRRSPCSSPRCSTRGC